MRSVLPVLSLILAAAARGGERALLPCRPDRARRRAIALAGLVLAACSLPAAADLISPEEESLAYRYVFSMAVDRVDQFCASEGINKPCHIPGTAFEGGGTGFCRREVDDWDMKIDLTCTLRHPLVIDRQVPESAEYMPVPQLCSNIKEQADEVLQKWLAHTNFTCDRPVELPTDRFCRGKRRGEACQVEGMQQGRRAVFAGRCAVEVERITYFHFGRGEAHRELLTCQPAKGAQVRRYQPVGFFRNLLMLL